MKTQMMIKTDVSVLYKTKLCKKFSANGYCPYGMRCQFIHDLSETPQQRNPPMMQQVQVPQEQPKPVAVAPAAPQQLEKVATYNPMTGALNPEPVVEEAAVVKPVEESEEAVAPVPKAEMKLNCTAFQFTGLKSTAIPEPAASATSAIIGTKAAGAVLAASGTGGFGNQQTSMAFTLPKIIYKDILPHCVHNSIQEYQKKMKMYQKKVTKKKYFNTVFPPEVQYMNIYKEPVKRLACFQAISEQFDAEQKTAGCWANGVYVPPTIKKDEDEITYFYGDAQAYEKHLDLTLKQINQGNTPNISCINHIQES